MNAFHATSGLLLLWLCVACRHSPENATRPLRTPKWVPEARFAGDDQEAILKLSGRTGLARPRRVTLDAVGHPNVCNVVRVESSKTVAGYRVTQDILYLRRADWGGCDGSPFGDVVAQEGRWLAYAESLGTEERWRIVDGNTFDVELGTGVPYAAAKKIVVAINRDNLQDRRPKILQQLMVPFEQIGFAASAITRIELAPEWAQEQSPENRAYYVIAEQGPYSRFLVVKIESGEVGVYNVGSGLA